MGAPGDMVFTLLEKGRSTKAYFIEEWLRNSTQFSTSQLLLGSRVPRLLSQCFLICLGSVLDQICQLPSRS